MDLIFWRHADAEDGTPDINRQLTKKGKRQAKVMADWLAPRLPKNARILVSPALRTRQTVEALHMDYTVVEDLAPGAEVDELLAATGWPTAGGTVLVVGHQPTLGQAISSLLSSQDGSFSVKKGAIFWIVRGQEEGDQNKLQAAVSPDMLQE